MKKLAFLAILAMLVGCSTAQQANQQSLNSAQSFSELADATKAITTQDIETALADVHANGDQDLAALSCYPALEDFIKANPALQKPTVDGLISANQLKRDVLLGIQKNGSMIMAIRKLHVACAAYAGDEARFAAQFLIAIGAASHGVPALPAIPGQLNGLAAPIINSINP